MNKPLFELISPFTPKGDQPAAIDELTRSTLSGETHRVLLGVTGSGKTFTMAHVIAAVEKPALVIAPNKTLAAQLYNEFKSLFPNNAVEYFVSYYDYYQPEAYIPASDTYIQKDSSINETIDKLRHSATRSVLSRKDVIVVASVSCIYGLGAPEDYLGMRISLETDETLSRERLLRGLVEMQYERNDVDFHRGTFRVRGDRVEIFPAYEEDRALRIEFFGDQIDSLAEIDPLIGTVVNRMTKATLFPASHYVTDKATMRRAIDTIKVELKERVDFFTAQRDFVEAQRIEERTNFDLEMMVELGYCNGIENYSRHLTGRKAGQPPPTLLDYFPEDFIVFLDESHITVPQLGAMYRGDHSRKSTLVQYGFRLPSALDNRPLMFEEFQERVSQIVYVSATPADYELSRSALPPVEQIVRPTGLVDPEIVIRPAGHQVDDLHEEILNCSQKGGRVLVTTLTKRMAEDLTEYYTDLGIRVRYLHADVSTLERMEIIRDLRLGAFDVLVGINLLREGLDIPEVSLVAILDADKEGFLRSARSLVQTFGRAARNVDGRVILYADRITAAMKQAMDETDRRRNKQIAYNLRHGITPVSISKPLNSALDVFYKSDAGEKASISEAIRAYGDMESPEKMIERLEKEMIAAADDLDFERAAALRDQMNEIKKRVVFDL